MKGFVFIAFETIVIFILIRSHLHFMKSNFYLKKVKDKPYLFEILFYLFVVSPIIFISLGGAMFLLVKLLY